MMRSGAWKLFTLFLLFGLIVSLGIRAARREPAGAEPPDRASTEPTPHAGHDGARGAHDGHGSSAADAPARAEGLLVDLGNTICPINEAEVDGSTYVEWNHLRVAFCCPGCDKKFLADPEAALAQAGIEWKGIADAIAAYQDAPPEHKAHRLAELRRKAKIIREP